VSMCGFPALDFGRQVNELFYAEIVWIVLALIKFISVFRQ